MSDASAQRLLQWSAGLGVFVWLVHRFAADADLVTSTLMMGIVVVVPLGVSLARGIPEARMNLLSMLEPAAAVGAVVSLTLEPCAATSLFVLPWLVFSALVAVSGATSLRKSSDASARAQSAGWLLLFFGGLWLWLSRAALDPLGQGNVGVLLMAVHFHFAGFGALVLMSKLAQQLGELAAAGKAPTVLSKAASPAPYGLAFGVVLAAAGISGAAVLGVLGSLLVSLALLAQAYVCLFYLTRHQGGMLGKGLLLISALSILISMPLAGLWALSRLLQISLLDFSWMLRVHGMANGHGVVLAGLLACILQARSKLARALHEPQPNVELDGAGTRLNAGAE